MRDRLELYTKELNSIVDEVNSKIQLIEDIKSRAEKEIRDIQEFIKGLTDQANIRVGKIQLLEELIQEEDLITGPKLREKLNKERNINEE